MHVNLCGQERRGNEASDGVVCHSQQEKVHEMWQGSLYPKMQGKSRGPKIWRLIFGKWVSGIRGQAGRSVDVVQKMLGKEWCPNS